MSDSSSLGRPHVIGRYLEPGGGCQFLPASRSELDRMVEAYIRTISTFGFAPGRFALLISTVEEIVQAGPIEQACIDLGLVMATAEHAAFDALRVESIVRRFDVAAVFGVSAAVLEGLRGLGHDPSKVFEGCVVWARSDTFREIEAMPGVTARCWIELGPTLALGCAASEGAHLDGREWTVETDAGQILLTSRLERALPTRRLATAVHGYLDRTACPCGSIDPRIIED